MIAVDLFAGAGGLSLGLRRAGFVLAGAIEFDDRASSTYRQNLGDHVLQEDVATLGARAYRKSLGLDQGELDLLAGGPPCQGFSVQRRGGSGDLRNLLLRRFADFALEFRPRAFLIENVPGLAFSKHRALLNTVLYRLEEAGYTISLIVLNALDAGVAQDRTRLFIVGLKHGGPFGVSPRRVRHTTVRDAIGDLPSPPQDGSVHPQFPNHFRESRLSPINLSRLKCIPMGGGREDLPRSLQLECHRRNATHRHLDVYGRLHWERPSGTITARFDSFTRGRFGHPTEHRSLTVREGARLQGFPDAFAFVGNREETAMQVGNAVPPPLAAIVGRTLKRNLAHT